MNPTVLVVPNLFLTAPEVSPVGRKDLDEALTTRWDTDALMAQYEGDRRLSYAQEPMALMTLVVYDLDRPGKEPWDMPPDAARLLAFAQATPDDLWAIYPTVAGARLVYVLDRKLPVDKWRRVYEQKARALANVDPATCDFTRLNRLPYSHHQTRGQLQDLPEVTPPVFYRNLLAVDDYDLDAPLSEHSAPATVDRTLVAPEPSLSEEETDAVAQRLSISLERRVEAKLRSDPDYLWPDLAATVRSGEAVTWHRDDWCVKAVGLIANTAQAAGFSEDQTWAVIHRNVKATIQTADSNPKWIDKAYQHLTADWESDAERAVQNQGLLNLGPPRPPGGNGNWDQIATRHPGLRDIVKSEADYLKVALTRDVIKNQWWFLRRDGQMVKMQASSWSEFLLTLQRTTAGQVDIPVWKTIETPKGKGDDRVDTKQVQKGASELSIAGQDPLDVLTSSIYAKEALVFTGTSGFQITRFDSGQARFALSHMEVGYSDLHELPEGWDPSVDADEALRFLQECFPDDWKGVLYWMGHVPDVNGTALPMMLLMGGPGTGKSLIGEACAGVFSSQAGRPGASSPFFPSENGGTWGDGASKTYLLCEHEAGGLSNRLMKQLVKLVREGTTRDCTDLNPKGQAIRTYLGYYRYVACTNEAEFAQGLMRQVMGSGAEARAANMDRLFAVTMNDSWKQRLTLPGVADRIKDQLIQLCFYFNANRLQLQELTGMVHSGVRAFVFPITSLMDEAEQDAATVEMSPYIGKLHGQLRRLMDPNNQRPGDLHPDLGKCSDVMSAPQVFFWHRPPGKELMLICKASALNEHVLSIDSTRFNDSVTRRYFRDKYVTKGPESGGRSKVKPRLVKGKFDSGSESQSGVFIKVLKIRVPDLVRLLTTFDDNSDLIDYLGTSGSV